jgi:hypothetical protein
MQYDIIIVGSGIAGLYSAYLITKLAPNVSFIILEKNHKKWIGGRTNNDSFYGTKIVTGAGIVRKNKDKLLLELLHDLSIKYSEFKVDPYYSSQVPEVVNIKKIMQQLKNKAQKNDRLSFKDFAIMTLGDELYQNFVISSGYHDYENADMHDVIARYGMDDNACCWTGISVNWKELIDTLCVFISNKIKTSQNVVNIIKTPQNKFIVETATGKKYFSNKVILATTITSLRQLFPLQYDNIRSQPFIRIYGKFNHDSAEIMKEYVKGYIIVPGALQKIIPMGNGIYMIAYSDGAYANYLKNYIENNAKNRAMFCDLLIKALGINAPLRLSAIKGYYWDVGTHYYAPLPDKYKTREEFIREAQYPIPDVPDVLVVGEVISLHQGWVNGALESVQAVLTKKWINMEIL